MSAPKLVRGTKAIGLEIGLTAKEAETMMSKGRLPVFRIGGTPYATKGGLREWAKLARKAKLPIC